MLRRKVSKDIKVMGRKYKEVYFDLGKEVEKSYSKIKKDSHIDLGGGNCGMVAYAIYVYIKERYSKHVKFGILTNATDENDLIYGDREVYHIYLISGRSSWDETGKIGDEYLLKLSEDQYGDMNPIRYIFDMPKEEDKVMKVIRWQTNFEEEWGYFYKFLIN